MANATRTTSPMASAAVSGAVSGLIVLVVIVLMDHFIFSGRETRGMGLGRTLLFSAVGGAVLGAIVGAVVGVTRSLATGMVTGAVLFAALKLLALPAAGGFTVMAVIMGLVYGAGFGWVAASSAAKAMDAA